MEIKVSSHTVFLPFSLTYISPPGTDVVTAWFRFFLTIRSTKRKARDIYVRNNSRKMEEVGWEGVGK